MIPHDIFSMESAKAAEYGIAVAAFNPEEG